MNSKTLADILDEMRTFDERCDHRPFSWQMVDAMLKRLADRIEAAAEREIPQPDPNWKDICAKCADGDIEPRFCAYYGEPNGCNSPIYGEHPSAEKSSAVGNAAAMRAALEKIVRVAEEWDTPGIHAVQATLYRILEAARAALAAPVRNCDRFRTADEVSAYWGANVHAVPLHGDAYAMRIDGETYPTFLDWLMAPAKEGK